jgi:hypothetical protein
MVAAGQFRHYAAVVRMQIHLAEERVAEQTLLAVVQCHAGFIAGGFYTEDSQFDPIRDWFGGRLSYSTSDAGRTAADQMPAHKRRKDAPPLVADRREQRKSQQNHVLRQLLRCVSGREGMDARRPQADKKPLAIAGASV